MRILLSNDDRYSSSGIQRLRRILKQLKAATLVTVFNVVALGLASCSLRQGYREPQSEEFPRTHGGSDKDLLLFSWPVSPPFRLTQKFNRFPSSPHDGIDLGGTKNAPIFAAHDGWVSYVGRDFSGYGILVIVDSGRGWTTFYSHLNRAYVKQKQHLQRGAQLGAMGATGNAKGVHLHFELRREKIPMDPLVYLPALEARL